MRRRWKILATLTAVVLTVAIFFVAREPQFEFIESLNGVGRKASGLMTVHEPSGNTYIVDESEYFFYFESDLVKTTMDSELTRKGWVRVIGETYRKGDDMIDFKPLDRELAYDFGFSGATCMVVIRRHPGWFLRQWHKVQLWLSPP